jgi:hypothetical protein
MRTAERVPDGLEIVSERGASKPLFAGCCRDVMLDLIFSL